MPDVHFEQCELFHPSLPRACPCDSCLRGSGPGLACTIFLAVGSHGSTVGSLVGSAPARRPASVRSRATPDAGSIQRRFSTSYLSAGGHGTAERPMRQANSGRSGRPDDPLAVSGTPAPTRVCDDWPRARGAAYRFGPFPSGRSGVESTFPGRAARDRTQDLGAPMHYPHRTSRISASGPSASVPGCKSAHGRKMMNRKRRVGRSLNVADK